MNEQVDENGAEVTAAELNPAVSAGGRDPLPRRAPTSGPDVSGAGGGDPESAGSEAAGTAAHDTDGDAPDPSAENAEAESEFADARLIDFYLRREITAARFLAALDGRTEKAIPEDERAEALVALEERDPELTRTRGLYLEAIEIHGGRLGASVARFVSDVMSEVVEAPNLWPPHHLDPLEALERIAISLAADLRDRKKSRRAHGQLMLAVVYLAHLRNLPFEPTIELLSERLGPPPERDRPVQNVRQERLRHLARPGVSPDGLRRWLDVLEPWRRRAREWEERARSAETSLVAAREDLAEARERHDDLIERLSAAERALQDERERIRQLEGRVQGAAIVSDHELTDLRAALERFLIDRLTPVLQTAVDALEVDHPQIARQKLDIARDIIHEQITWLRSD